MRKYFKKKSRLMMSEGQGREGKHSVHSGTNMWQCNCDSDLLHHGEPGSGKSVVGIRHNLPNPTSSSQALTPKGSIASKSISIWDSNTQKRSPWVTFHIPTIIKGVSGYECEKINA